MKQRNKALNLDNFIIRPALLDDLPAIAKMARTIWDGHDYLPKIAPKWIEDGNFFLLVDQAQVLGCVKITLFPDKVLWLEGLRIHARYQGKGLGRHLNQFAFGHALDLRKQDPAIRFEFCTYYLNVESLHMARKAGFRIASRFYVLNKKGLQKTLDPMLITDYEPALFRHYPKHIPAGWQSVHNHPEGLAWIREHCQVFQTPKATYLLGGLSGKCILPLTQLPPDIKAELPYFQHFYGTGKQIELIIPFRWRTQLPNLEKQGFRFWEKNPAHRANMLILEM